MFGVAGNDADTLRPAPLRIGAEKVRRHTSGRFEGMGGRLEGSGKVPDAGDRLLSVTL